MTDRLTPSPAELIRRAAEVVDETEAEFVMRAAVSRASDVLADRRLFVLDDASWTEFLAILKRPTTPKPRLAALLRDSPPPWTV